MVTTQDERLDFLIKAFKDEGAAYKDIEIPADRSEKQKLYVHS